MNFQKLCSDYNISTAGEGDKHYRNGWVNIPCPFCRSTGNYHLGINIENEYGFCWKCGYHKIEQILIKLLNISYNETKEIIKKYKGKTSTRYKKTEIKIKKKAFKLPKNQNIFNSSFAVKYMKKRGFTENNIKILIKDFELKSTQNICPFENMELKYRILAPIHWQGDIVSWQTRDMTNRSNLKYITCSKEIEKIHHKQIFYGHKNFNIENTKEVILTEGIFDVWKLHLAGILSIAGFGVELKIEQILLLKKIPKIVLWLDPDSAGERKANELEKRLIFAGCNIQKIETNINKDPGDLSIKQIQQIYNKNKENQK